MEFELTNPRAVGGSLQQEAKTLTKFELVAFSMNVQPGHTDKGVGVLALVLLDRAANHQESIRYWDASALAFLDSPLPEGAVTLRDAVEQLVFAKLAGDGKLPVGAAKQDGLTVDLSGVKIAESPVQKL